MSRHPSDDHALGAVDQAHPRSPRMGTYEHDHPRAWATEIAELDGFVFEHGPLPAGQRPLSRGRAQVRESEVVSPTSQ
jgi:hypothetical protein